ncbi:MAG: SOS response-associated peptidase [Verrucomicrobiaceae bacterium]
MCSRLNQFATFPALSLALRMMRIEHRKKKKDEDRKAGEQVINNICPTDYADVITMENGATCIERMRFGLVPSWAKGSKKEMAKKFALTFNARCETIFELASYRGPILRQRCLIPVRGWHEWPDRTTPYFIHRADDTPLLLAGIWDVWESPYPEDFESGAIITSMSVVTTPPGRYMAKFHDRSPLVLEGDAALTWMQPETKADDLRALIQPYESEHLEAYRVSKAVSQPRNKSDDVLSPIAPPVPQSGDEPVKVEEEASSQLKLF